MCRKSIEKTVTNGSRSSVGKEESGRESEDFSRSGFKVVLMFRQHDKRESLAICLEEQGFEVTAFSSPLAGLFHLDRCFVDVVVWEWSGSRESHEAGAFYSGPQKLDRCLSYLKLKAVHEQESSHGKKKKKA